MSDMEFVSDDVMAAIRTAINDSEVTFIHPAEISHFLRSVWDKDYKYGNLIFAGEPEWLIGFSKEFIKSVTGLDKKLQGRLMKVLMHLSEKPMTVIGDTVKPLEGDLKGLWRYRIADFRLCYLPNKDKRTVRLLSFESRGDAYK
jgi:mRNA-degrading endonuclease RelE of RelBE toxin-antitoxin system